MSLVCFANDGTTKFNGLGFWDIVDTVTNGDLPTLPNGNRSDT